VGVHVVISQYIFESMDSMEVNSLSPYVGLGTCMSINNGFAKLYSKIDDEVVSELKSVEEFLKHELKMIENCQLPYTLKAINSITLTEPHDIITKLQDIQEELTSSANIAAFLPFLCEQISTLISECHKLLKDVHALTRKLNQNVQKCLNQRNYYDLICVIENYMIDFPARTISQHALTLIQQALPYCDEKTLQFIMRKCEVLQMSTLEYNVIKLGILPLIKAHVNHMYKINSALMAGPPQLQIMCHYITSKKFLEKIDVIVANYLVTAKEITPSVIQYVKEHPKDCSHLIKHCI